jgi:hypothetical protein
MTNLPAPAAVVMNPTNIVLTVVGNSLQLTWPTITLAGGWRRRRMRPGRESWSNWFNVAGATTTNRVFIPLNKAHG